MYFKSQVRLQTQDPRLQTPDSKVPYLRAPGKHLDKIVMQVVVELALKVPFKRAGLELARRQVESVRIVVNILVFQADSDLNASIRYACRPLEQGVFVPVQFLCNFGKVFEALVRSFAHEVLLSNGNVMEYGLIILPRLLESRRPAPLNRQT